MIPEMQMNPIPKSYLYHFTIVNEDIKDAMDPAGRREEELIRMIPAASLRVGRDRLSLASKPIGSEKTGHAAIKPAPCSLETVPQLGRG
jgi:hypothetical protein